MEFISLPKKDIVLFKQVEEKLVRLLNTNKARCCWDDVNEILVLVRNIGTLCKECKQVGECPSD